MPGQLSHSSLITVMTVIMMKTTFMIMMITFIMMMITALMMMMITLMLMMRMIKRVSAGLSHTRLPQPLVARPRRNN